MASLTQRMLGAAKLDVGTYEEVEADTTATVQAMAVVLISSIAAGIGGIGLGISGLVRLTLAALVSWILWASLVWVIGTKLLPEPETKANVGELLRTTGFSSSPGVLRILGFIPLIGWLINLLVAIWMLIAMVIAVRQALDFRSTARAVGVCLIGWLVSMILFWILMPKGIVSGVTV